MRATRLWPTSLAGLAVLVIAGCGEPTDEAPNSNELPDSTLSFGVGVDSGGDQSDASQTAEDIAVADVDPALAEPDEICEDNNDCSSGFCVLGPKGQVCAPKCVENCPKHWGCSAVQASAGDVVWVCLPRYISLCNPCQEHKDCKELLQAGASFCIDHGPPGRFCGGQCDLSQHDPLAACPPGYACKSFTVPGGEPVGQCQLQTGECACSKPAIDKALSTSCQVVNSHGACGGIRKCTPGGLSACDGPSPAAETCDGADQDCDGQTDEDLPEEPCGTSNPKGKCFGLSTCVDGEIGCDAAEPAAEVCDGVDQDCDGQTDEGACDDANGCTNDACDGAGGQCLHVPVPGKCEDGDVCTWDDACANGVCAGKPVDCDDGDDCSADSCQSASGCVHLPQLATACDDGDPCTGADTCAKGGCSGTPANDGSACDDGSLCTAQDACTLGVCAGKPVSCDDADPCTDGACVSGKGCVVAWNDALCDDGDPCTIGDQCGEGACQGKGVKACDDGNPCTADNCAAKVGCQHTPTPGACDDGNVCTTGDKCDQGVCFGSKLMKCDDANLCTADACHPKTGCLHQAAALKCDDGEPCSIGDYCAGKVCKAGTALKCVDGNPCTDDSCKPGQGCLFAHNQAGCDDGNACTAGDGCVQGACKPGKLVVCNDANPCTVEWCEAETGCKSGLNSGNCDDGDQCTTNDLCKSGACVAGPPAKCDDGNPCTDDSCAPDKGCQHMANAKPCKSDGQPCTQDVCVAAACKHLSIKDGDPCDDGNKCTTSEVCKGGKCSGSIDKDSDKDGAFDKQCGGKDCDDNDKAIHPDAEEICDDKDNDCKGGVDEICDQDNDGYCALGLKMPTGCPPNCTEGKDCDPAKCPKTCVHGATDCNDKDSSIHPGANEKLDFVITRERLFEGHPNASLLKEWRFAAVQASDGSRHVVYRGWNYDGKDGWRYSVFASASKDGRGWHASEVARHALPATDLAIAARDFGQPAVAYRVLDNNKAQLHIATRSQGKWLDVIATDADDAGHHVALAVAKSGQVHALHYEASKGDLLHTWGSQGKYQTETVDSAGDTGQHISAAVDGQGSLHVSYFDSSKADLRYAKRVAGKWTLSTLLSQGAPGMHTALALDGTDRPHIIHYELIQGDALYTRLTPGGWKTETIESSGTVGIRGSLALDAQGHAYASYISAHNNRVRFATNQSGAWKVQDIYEANVGDSFAMLHSNGQPEVVLQASVDLVGLDGKRITDRNGLVLRRSMSKRDGALIHYGVGPRMAGGLTLDGQGGARVLLYSNNASRLRMGVREKDWTLTSFDQQPYKSIYNLDAAFSGPTVHACARNSTDGLIHLTNEGGVWKQAVIDAGGNKIGEHCRVQLDGQGQPHVVYRDSINHVFRYAGRASGKWTLDVPDTKSGVGSAAALALGGGQVDIVYPSSGLRHARRQGDAWVIGSVDPSPGVGNFPALARDAQGHLHAVYFHEQSNPTKRTIRYATNKSGKWQVETLEANNSYYDWRTALVIDGGGHLHATFYHGSYLRYATDRFGKWSLVNGLRGTGSEQESNNYNLLAVDSAGVVHNVGITQNNYGFVHGTYSYTNQVDHNCDGK